MIVYKPKKTERIYPPPTYGEISDAAIIPIYHMRDYGERVKGQEQQQLTSADIIPHIPECDSEYCAVTLNRCATFHIFRRIGYTWEVIGVLPLVIDAFRAGGYAIDDVYGNAVACYGVSGYAPEVNVATLEALDNDEAMTGAEVETANQIPSGCG